MIRYSAPFLLSKEGSDRGTAYGFANKVVTLAGKTHVIWTDAIAVTRGRTLDHASGQWGEVVTIGEGVDNHNSPSLTADARGRLHVAYGPHNKSKQYADGHPGGTFKHAIGNLPGTMAGLEKNGPPCGVNATYPCLLTTTRGNDVIVYRGEAEPKMLMFQRAHSNETWDAPKALMEQDIPPQYTHVGALVSCAPDGTLYVAGHYYGIKRGGSIGVAILKSKDGGDTWTDLRGELADVPVRYDDRFSVPHAPAEFDPRAAGLDLDRQGRPWVATSSYKIGRRGSLLSCWEGDRWRTIDLADFIPADLTIVADGLCIDTAGRIHVVGMTYPTEIIRNAPDKRWWSHKSLEIAHLMSGDDGKTFSYSQVSPPDADVPNWLPSISRPGPFHPVEKPVILWTHGASGQFTTTGDKCRPETRTDIYCVRVEDLS